MTDGPEAYGAGPNDPTTMRISGLQPVEPAENIQAEHTLTRADQATVDALRPGTALLVVLRGPNTGARFLLDDDSVTSGRHPDSDIFLDDVTVSRRHAELERTADGYLVRDAGSLNGTYLNQKIVSGDTHLSNGDEIQVGRFKLVFVLGTETGQ